MEQIIVNGLYLGASYALIALGLTLIFALMNVLNFAHGQMYVMGGFITYTVYAQLGLPFVVGLILYKMNPEYMSTLFTDPAGHTMLMAGSFMMITGAIIMKRMVTIKV